MADRLRILTVYPPTVTVTGPQPTKRRRRPRRLTVAQVLQQAAKAGVAVARIEITDNKFVLVFGELSPDTEPTTNPWDRVLTDAKN